MNEIQVTKPSGRQYNLLLDALFTIPKYKKITIDHVICIKFLSDVTVSYIIFSTDDVMNTTNNEIAFLEITIFFEEHFEIKFREGSVLKYLNFRVFPSPLGFSVYQTEHIMELVNEWLPTGKYRKVDTLFSKDSTYEN